MQKATSIGGVFIRAKNPAQLAEWYASKLGVEINEGIAEFHWLHPSAEKMPGKTVWSVFPEDSDYFGNKEQQVMINYQVPDLNKMIEQLKSQGVAILGSEEYEYGKFAWVTDAEGNRIELWEPKSGSNESSAVPKS